MKKKRRKRKKDMHASKKERKTRNRFDYPNLKTKKMKEITAKKEEYKGRRLVQRKTIKKS